MMTPMPKHRRWTKIEGLLRKIRSFRQTACGTSAVMFAIALPVIIGTGGFAVDYASVTSTTNRLQSVIDSTAIAVAREMTVSAVTPDRAQILAVQYVAANIPANTPYVITPTATIEENNMAVRVVGTQQVYTPFGMLERLVGVTTVSATALARVTANSAQSKLCLLSLGEGTKNGVYLHNNARVKANGCILHSNSLIKRSVVLSQGSQLSAGLVCARGGIQNNASMLVGPLVTDCAQYKDPLASKPEPTAGPVCNHTNFKKSAGTHVLSPGVYCGQTEFSGTASVMLNPGVYHFRDGALIVRQNASFTAKGVTLMFGSATYFRFLDNSLIELEAPTSGASAGMLLWESNASPAAKAKTGGDDGDDSSSLPGAVKKKDTSQHHIKSGRARILTGTIYLKKGLLTIDSSQAIADQSPYTLLVVNQLDLFDGPMLVLNSNYESTNIPVPPGLGALGARELRLGM